MPKEKATSAITLVENNLKFSCCSTTSSSTTLNSSHHLHPQQLHETESLNSFESSTNGSIDVIDGTMRCRMALPSTTNGIDTDSSTSNGKLNNSHNILNGCDKEVPSLSPPLSTKVNNELTHSSSNGSVSSTSGTRKVNDFRFGKLIGEGSFSTVYLAQDIHTNKEYASKCHFFLLSI